MIGIDEYKKKVDAAVSFLRTKILYAPEVVIILGTGLGDLDAGMLIDTKMSYEDIPGFPRVTVPGHPGNLILGSLSGKNVAVLQGRFHFYEGYSTRELTLPLRVLSLVGADTPPGMLVAEVDPRSSARGSASRQPVPRVA